MDFPDLGFFEAIGRVWFSLMVLVPRLGTTPASRGPTALVCAWLGIDDGEAPSPAAVLTAAAHGVCGLHCNLL
jgi:hypothetical protein